MYIKYLENQFIYSENEYQNHFISLRSDNPITVIVNLKTIPLIQQEKETIQDTTLYLIEM